MPLHSRQLQITHRTNRPLDYVKISSLDRLQLNLDAHHDLQQFRHEVMHPSGYLSRKVLEIFFEAKPQPTATRHMWDLSQIFEVTNHQHCLQISQAVPLDHVH
jgi:hypothetical protein